MAGPKTTYCLEECLSSLRPPPEHLESQRQAIGPLRHAAAGRQRQNVRAKPHLPRRRGIEDRMAPEGIVTDRQLSNAAVPDRDEIATIESLEHICTPPLI